MTGTNEWKSIAKLRRQRDDDLSLLSTFCGHLLIYIIIFFSRRNFLTTVVQKRWSRRA
jgi:hypothetical protein